MQNTKTMEIISPAEESTKASSMRLPARMTNTAILLRCDGRFDIRGNEKVKSKKSNSRKVVSFIILDISGNRLLQRITSEARINGETMRERRRLSLIQDSKNYQHAGSIPRPGKEKGQDT